MNAGIKPSFIIIPREERKEIPFSPISKDDQEENKIEQIRKEIEEFRRIYHEHYYVKILAKL